MGNLVTRGPEPPKACYNAETAGLSDNVAFELPDGRWGIKLYVGALIMPGDGTSITCTRAASLADLHDLSSLKFCRELPGNVSITYEPKDGHLTQNGIPAAINEQISVLNRERRDGTSSAKLHPEHPSLHGHA